MTCACCNPKRIVLSNSSPSGVIPGNAKSTAIYRTRCVNDETNTTTNDDQENDEDTKQIVKSKPAQKIKLAQPKGGENSGGPEVPKNQIQSKEGEGPKDNVGMELVGEVSPKQNKAPHQMDIEAEIETHRQRGVRHRKQQPPRQHARHASTSASRSVCWRGGPRPKGYELVGSNAPCS